MALKYPLMRLISKLNPTSKLESRCTPVKDWPSTGASSTSTPRGWATCMVHYQALQCTDTSNHGWQGEPLTRKLFEAVPSIVRDLCRCEASKVTLLGPVPETHICIHSFRLNRGPLKTPSSMHSLCRDTTNRPDMRNVSQHRRKKGYFHQVTYMS